MARTTKPRAKAPRRRKPAPDVPRVLAGPMTPLVDEAGRPRVLGGAAGRLDACTYCPGKCCRTTVRVTIADAVHFCRALALPFHVCFTTAPGMQGHSFPVDEWPHTREFVLREVPGGGCRFLGKVGSFDRRTVYAARPSTCRLYPLSWSTLTARGGPHRLHCPVPYGVSPAGEAQFQADCAEALARLEVHQAVVDAWAAEVPAGQRGLERLVDFAVRRTVAIHGWPAEVADDLLSRATAEERLARALGPQPGAT